MTEAELTFEAAMSELESIVDALENEDLDLDEALALFERGVSRLRTASHLLDAARGRVEELIEVAGGSWEIRPVSPEGEDESEPTPDQ
jgi:exodeoxyribonuclease VII small subunit